MYTRRALPGIVPVCATLLLVGSTLAVVAEGQTLEPIEQLGKTIFFDQNLSANSNQSCATCHGPAAGWTGPDQSINTHGAVYEGSIPGAFGHRKPPSSAYATFAPILHAHKKGLWTGGNFWDGRATGWTLGSPAAEQARGPFLNPKEQALNTPGDVVTRVCLSSYGDLFMSVWGTEACDPANVSAAFDDIAYSVAAYGYSTALASVFLIGLAMAILQVAITPLLRVAGGEEHFISAVTGDSLAGFARLRTGGERMTGEIADAALLRELHVYGSVVPLGRMPSPAQRQHRRIEQRTAGSCRKGSGR